jgi:hypothetical protein
LKINLNDYIIDERIFNVKFSCDLEQCKGACCTMKGEDGAPVLEEEIKILSDNILTAGKYLPDERLEYIRRNGFYKRSRDKIYTNTINDGDCVFVCYENGIAKCSFEKAYFNGESDFRKPVSCHLFPVRISGRKRNVIKYEKINECEAALVKGNEEGKTIFEFLKDSLKREFGKEFFYKTKNIFLNK